MPNKRMPWNKGLKTPLSIRKKQSLAATGRKSNHWNGGKSITVAGYVLVWQPNHPKCIGNKRNYIFEHQLVMEKFLGRYLKSEERIHHKDHDRQNNKIENLQLTNNVDHGKLHQPKGSKFGKNKPRH